MRWLLVAASVYVEEFCCVQLDAFLLEVYYMHDVVYGTKGM